MTDGLRICARAGCGNTLEKHRHLYCCKECGRVAYNAVRRGRGENKTYRVMKTRRGRGPTATTRRCLKCGRKFKSDGPHNRICARCNLRNEGIYDRAIFHADMGGRTL